VAKKTKFDMVMDIIETLYDGSDVDLREELRTKNKLQLRLQKLPNKKLAIILENLEENGNF
jgi:hypothetical protein